MRKVFAALALVAVIIMAASTGTVHSQTTVVQTQNQYLGNTFYANGLSNVKDEVVRTITGFDANQPVYLIVGEHQLQGRAPAGNAWLQDSKMKKYWALYQMTQQGQYWTVRVPSAFYVLGYVRFNVGQASGPGNVRFAQIHLFQGDPSYYIDGSDNALIVNLR